jgi:N-acetylglucosamine-6-phosphate deacetylase
MILRGRHYATEEMIDVILEKGEIRQVAPAGTHRPDHEAGWLAPAWFDLQINGCQGLGFSSEKLDHAAVVGIVRTCREHGIGAICPTLVTNSFEALRHGFSTLSQVCDSDRSLAKALPCFHLEGPYISPEDGPRGAHSRQYVRSPDKEEFERLQDAAGGRIRLVTLAPEHERAIPFIEYLVGTGVVVAIGHTAASASIIRDAVAAGARLSTHLGNGTHAMLPRHENYLWDQLADDNLWASIICDGHHLPPGLIRCFLRVKTPARTILTCDASPLAGLPPGNYREWGQEFHILPEGKIVLQGTNYLGGAWAFTDLCIGNVMRFADVSLRDAIDMATVRPRQLLGLRVPAIQPGEHAEIVLFDWAPRGEIHVKQVVTET